MDALTNAGQLWHHRHARVLEAKDRQGSFCTAPAKGYPKLFSKTTALAIRDIIEQYATLCANGDAHEVEHESLQAQLAHFYMPLDPYLDAHTAGAYGQDYAGHMVRTSTPAQRRRAEQLEEYSVDFNHAGCGDGKLLAPQSQSLSQPGSGGSCPVSVPALTSSFLELHRKEQKALASSPFLIQNSRLVILPDDDTSMADSFDSPAHFFRAMSGFNQRKQVQDP